jgi:anhydro-N-acetylmuramic acid kinase
MSARKAGGSRLREVNAPRAMTVAGVMSGTSADGVDVAVCRISPPREAGGPPRLRVLGHSSFRYPKAMRGAILAAAGAQQANSSSVPELARLNWRLGEFYAECVEEAVASVPQQLDLVAMHGQTIYHQPVAAKYLGKAVRCTWQIGEPSVVAERLRVPVVSDFRPADVAAGGQGAPLVPMLDYCLFRHATRNRILLNLGGIANLSAIPGGGSVDDVMAFDTGPANMVIDACMEALYQRPYDRGGAIAGKGRVLESVVGRLAGEAYFRAAPPKSCGREEFGAAFAGRLQELCRIEKARPEDVIATATALTVRTILDGYSRWCWPHLGQKAPRAVATDLLAAGGGARNETLMRQLTEGFRDFGVRVGTTAQAGVATAAKEAAAFALLGWLRWHGMTGNVASATGARRAVVLGKLTYSAVPR